jgi:hypothetical protein
MSLRQTLPLMMGLGLALLITCRAALAGNMSSYSYRQENLDSANNPVVYEGSDGPLPIELMAMPTTPNSIYKFDVSAVQNSYTSLSARAFVSVSVNQLGGSDELWDTVEASALAEAALTDVAFVQGVEDVPNGEVIFQWVLTGQSGLLLDTRGPNLVGVNEFSARTTLTSTIPGKDETIIDEFIDFPNSTSSNTLFQQTLPSASGALLFHVPWEAGQEVPVNFDLSASATMDISNLDAAGFIGELDLDFFNTATMQGVEIVDNSGVRIPGATLESVDGFVYPALPEPNSGLLTLMAVGLLGHGLRVMSGRRAA